MDPLAMAAVRPVLALAKRTFRPVLSGLEADIRKRVKGSFDALFDGYRDYLSRAYARHSMFTSLAFRNEQRRLQEIYLPLTLTFPNGETAALVDDYPVALLKQVSNLMVVDTAGMGKTTLLKFMFLRCVDSKAAVPVYVELRRLNKKVTLLDYLLKEMARLGEPPKKELLLRFLDTGRFLILLDGYDEIAERDREDVTHDLIKFLERTGRNHVIMTSRSEVGLASFSSFRKFTIRPLLAEEAYALIGKYDNHGIGEALVKQLERDEIHGVREFLVNPLLVSLLYRSYEYKQVIPLKRHIFYSQVFEALFENHDLAKDGGEFNREKRSGLDMDRFEKFLRALAARSYKRNVIESTRVGWINLIDDSKISVGEKNLSATAILHDLTHAVPLMTLEGAHYRWIHRSIQEYFAACNICYDRSGETVSILQKRYSRPDFESHANLIIMAGDIDQFAFRTSIGSKMASELLVAYEKLEASPIPGVDANVLKMRNSLIVGRELYVIDAAGASERPQVSERALEANVRIGGVAVSLEKRMLRFAGLSQPVWHSIQVGSPCVGEIETALGRRMRALSGKADLPFLVPVEPLEVSRLNLNFGTSEIWRLDDVQGPGCDSRYVAQLNANLSTASSFRFDADIAREYLSDLAEETAARDESGW